MLFSGVVVKYSFIEMTNNYKTLSLLICQSLQQDSGVEESVALLKEGQPVTSRISEHKSLSLIWQIEGEGSILLPCCHEGEG